MTALFTPEEVAIVERGISRGYSIARLHQELPGRTFDAVRNKRARMRGSDLIGTLPGQAAEKASALLRDRILDLIAKTANDRGVSFEEAAYAALTWRVA